MTQSVSYPFHDPALRNAALRRYFFFVSMIFLK